MKRTAFAFALLALTAPAAGAAATPEDNARLVVLTLPRATHAHEAVWLRVRVGAIPRGMEIVVRSDSGKLLGSISPFAIPSKRAAGTYTIPLPENASHEGRIAVRLSVEVLGAQPRPPTTREVEEVKLVYLPVD
jgi:hypothetical protein